MGWGDLIPKFLIFPKTALLILQREVSLFYARETGFFFLETEVLLDKFFEQNQTILPHGRVSLHGQVETCSCVLLNARNGLRP
jgi:hypothetical protein